MRAATQRNHGIQCRSLFDHRWSLQTKHLAARVRFRVCCKVFQSLQPKLNATSSHACVARWMYSGHSSSVLRPGFTIQRSIFLRVVRSLRDISSVMVHVPHAYKTHSATQASNNFNRLRNGIIRLHSALFSLKKAAQPMANLFSNSTRRGSSTDSFRTSLLHHPVKSEHCTRHI